MNFTELTCSRCGGDLTIQGNIYICSSCGKAFEKERISVADELRKVLDEQKQEMIANSRRQLWTEMHEKYINSAKITELAREIKKYLPEDYFANFCETANNGTDKQINDFLNNTSNEELADYADIVLDFMLKSAKVGNLSSISLFIERAYKGDTVNYDKYITEFEKIAENVKKGIYELIIPRDVFLAYSSADINTVIDLCDYLENQGISCFMALRNLRHGRGAVDNYDNALKTAIDNCKTVVFVSSTHSRSLTCDALTKELPYIRQKDLNRSPVEFANSYDKLPQEYMMPRVEYLIEEYCGDIAENITKEFFHSLEWCKNKKDVAARITKYLTSEVAETSRQRAERERLEAEQRSRELQQKLIEEQKKLEELRLRAAEEQRRAEELRLQSERQQVTYTQAPESAEGKYCKECKSFNAPNAKFCGKCGSREFFSSYDEYLESQFKYCKDCGAKNDIDSKFCNECGKNQFVATYKEYTAYKQRQLQEEIRKKKEAEERRLASLFEIKDGVLLRYKRESNSLDEVTVPDIIKKIGNKAFAYCDKLTRVVLPESIISIGECAFESCSKLTAVNLPESLTSIGKNAFSFCKSLTDINLPSSVSSIGGGAFSHCSKLRTIKLEATNKYFKIIDGCLYTKDGKTLLHYFASPRTSFTVPEGVTCIAEYAFNGSAYLESVVLPNSIIYIDEAAFAFCEKLSKINLPVNTASVGNRAFAFCSKLQHIELPKGLNYIGSSAFGECNSLEKILIPKSVTEIGKSAFYDCALLCSISCEAESMPSGWSKACFERCKAQILWGSNEQKEALLAKQADFFKDEFKITNGVLEEILTDAKTVSIPNFITHIQKSANNKNAEVLIIPESLKTIDSYFFQNCNYHLKEISVDENNSKFKSVDGALYNKDLSILIYCPNGKISLVIPEGVKNIADTAFVGCYSLKSLHIPSTVTNINLNGFKNSSIENIYVNESHPSYTSIRGVLFDKSAKKLIYYPRNIRNDIYVIPAGVEVIGKRAFYDRSNMLGIYITSGVKIIESEAFKFCSSFYFALSFPRSVTEIGDYAFDSFKHNVYIPSSVTKIGIRAFSEAHEISCEAPSKPFLWADDWAPYNVKKVWGYTFNSDVIYIGGFEIQKMKVKSFFSVNDKDIIIPYGLTSIASKAFSDNSHHNMLSVRIPASIKTVGSDIFHGCNTLKTVYCEAAECPSGWNQNWLGSCTANVIWGYGNDDLYSDPILKPSSESKKSNPSIQNTSAFKKTGTANASKKSTKPSVSKKSAESEFKITNGVLTKYNGKGSSIVIPEGVTSIGEGAFSGSNLSSVTIPMSVSSVEKNAFAGCNNLKTIYCETKKPLFGLPKNWHKEWLGSNKSNMCKAKIIWGYKH